jgi:pimeloyl-ACP methyl ester carboxylesterase
MGVSRWRAALLLGALLVAAACGGGDPQPPAVPPGPAEADALEFSTPDGVELMGLLFNPPDADGVVVMAHQQGGSGDDFIDLAVDFAEQRMASFLFDFRGYGHGADDGEDAEAQIDTNLDVDLAAAVDLMRQQGFERIALLGAGMGATAALHHAAEHDVVTVVALSPARRFAGLRVRPREVDETVTLLAGADDRRRLRDARFLARRMPNGHLLRVRLQGHGMEMFDDPDDAERLTYLVRNAFGGAFFKLMQDDARAAREGSDPS